MDIFATTVFGVNFGFQFFGPEEATDIMEEDAKGGMILSLLCVHIFFVRY